MKRGKPLKRTPLARGTSELKRGGRIKPRSTRHKDSAESLAIRASYREAHQKCEASQFLKSLGQIHSIADGIEIHHICGGTSGRNDVTSNLISLSPWIHHWVESDPIVGRIVCLVVKSLKTPTEINLTEFQQCSGMHLAGWLSLDKVVAACPQWLQPYRSTLLEAIAKE